MRRRLIDQEAAVTGKGAAEEDALYVLTAVLLTPAQFPGVLGDDFPAACGSLGLDPHPGGYGLVLGQDGLGGRWTVVIDDVPLVAVAIASWDCGMEYGLSPDDRSIVVSLPGWPLDVAVAAPDVPAPHDPAGLAEGSRPPLAPPGADTWGPAQRRLGADEIALRWADWRAQIGDGISFVAAEGSGGRPSGPARRVIEELHGYVNSPPPLGRIRSAFAPGGARTLRADGPGWSLVARTDDIAFVLLDDRPGDVVPVGRGPELPGLLAALDEMAARPA
ncbi:hypothetical protein [Streptomyces sp. NBC_01766]|uniref:hypothetical protein n=1 Tax=Streptomyces sp. NBC_01766 TaxID=2975936 RepID=UPI002DDA6FA4|nr:hypothetical protein [Streptomyces sp. NBC_01766]WSC18365.1 hypothetical protein OIE60_01180 [Streptomyces sp. NBC_01766]